MKDPASANADSGEGSYAQILKASSIIGGAQGLNYLIGMVRTKVLAVLLGPSGVGLAGLYQSTIGLTGVLTTLGIGSSGVREVAAASTRDDRAAQAKTVKVLRRASWITGFIGWGLTAALAWPLSVWMFGTGDKAFAFGVLGLALVFGAIGSGQRALLQGLRRIGDLARLSVLSAFTTTFVASGIYYWLGKEGIVPVILTTAFLNLGFSWLFAKRVKLDDIEVGPRETWARSKRLVVLGLPFMWSALLAAATTWAIRFLIVRDLGLEANGIYQAAWTLSGMFAGFILNAMGADFYPRLTAVAENNEKVNRLVNEQIEIGILLTLPLLLTTVTFAPWVILVFYTPEFFPASDLLPWFLVGMFGRVVGWPLGFIQAAKGAASWMYVSQTHGFVLLLSLSWVFLLRFGLLGLAFALVVFQPIQMALGYFIARRLSQFRYSKPAVRLLGLASLLVGICFLLHQLLPSLWAMIFNALFSIVAGIATLRGIASRLGPKHRIIRLACRVPGGRWACGLPGA